MRSFLKLVALLAIIALLAPACNPNRVNDKNFYFQGAFNNITTTIKDGRKRYAAGIGESGSTGLTSSSLRLESTLGFYFQLA